MGRKPDSNSKLKTTPLEPGDEQIGEWPHDRLVRMDARFCKRLERAIANGEEHTPGAQQGPTRW